MLTVRVEMSSADYKCRCVVLTVRVEMSSAD